jgi:hypothetical protein
MSLSTKPKWSSTTSSKINSNRIKKKPKYKSISWRKKLKPIILKSRRWVHKIKKWPIKIRNFSQNWPMPTRNCRKSSTFTSKTSSWRKVTNKLLNKTTVQKANIRTWTRMKSWINRKMTSCCRKCNFTKRNSNLCQSNTTKFRGS